MAESLLLFSRALVTIFNEIVLNMEYREAIADVEADQEPRQGMFGHIAKIFLSQIINALS